MNWENLRTCCLKGLKHGETTCPVCGRKLVIEEQEVKPTTNGLKATLLIPFIALTLNSCNETDYYESGIVKDKIENKVYMSPINDTSTVYRVIDCDTITKSYRRANKNLYLNMNKGDTVVWYNYKNKEYVIPAMTTYYSGGVIGKTTRSVFNVVSVNGIRPHNLPNLLRKQEIERLNQKAQQEYNNVKGR
ncbi:MAG: hypothetical protein IJ880_11770 [Bacilli bacterium]|nr:hypothetical protein [Bacilli bacterium]